MYPSDIISTTIIQTHVVWVAVVVHAGAILKGLREVFGALAVLHARCSWICSAARPMDHASLDCLKEHWLGVRIRPPCPNGRINILRCQQLLSPLQKNEEMNVGQSPLLEFNCVNILNCTPTNSVFVDVLDYRLLFQLKDTRHQLRTIMGRLSRKQFLSNLRLFRIGCAR
jgi:hypothetical protein